MSLGINGEQFNYFQIKPVNEREANPIYGGNNFFVNPTPEIKSFTNELGINIPSIHSYTTDVDGTRVAMGQDGVGLAHVNASEHAFHAIG